MSSNINSDVAMSPALPFWKEQKARLGLHFPVLGVLEQYVLDELYTCTRGSLRIRKTNIVEAEKFPELGRVEAKVTPRYTHMAVDWGTLSGARDVLRCVLDARAANEVKGRKLIDRRPNRAERRKRK